MDYCGYYFSSASEISLNRVAHMTNQMRNGCMQVDCTPTALPQLRTTTKKIERRIDNVNACGK